MSDVNANAAREAPELSPPFVPPNRKKWEDDTYSMVISSARSSGRVLPAGHEEAWREGFKYGWGIATDLYAPDEK